MTGRRIIKGPGFVGVFRGLLEASAGSLCDEDLQRVEDLDQEALTQALILGEAAAAMAMLTSVPEAVGEIGASDTLVSSLFSLVSRSADEVAAMLAASEMAADIRSARTTSSAEPELVAGRPPKRRRAEPLAREAELSRGAA